MLFKSEHGIGEVVQLKTSDKTFVVRNISIFTSGDIFNYKTNIVYEIEESHTNKTMIVKEEQIKS